MICHMTILRLQGANAHQDASYSTTINNNWFLGNNNWDSKTSFGSPERSCLDNTDQCEDDLTVNTRNH